MASPRQDPQMLSLQTEASTGPGRKRRRIDVACISCRNRKSRCSGQRPKCSTCIELGLTCDYVSSGNSNNAEKSYLRHIESRLDVLEDMFGRHIADLSTSCDGQRRNDRGPLSGEDEEGSPEQGRRRLANGKTAKDSATNGNQLAAASWKSADEGSEAVEDGEDGDERVEAQQQPDPTDGMGHFVFADEEDGAFFGPSSSIAFTSEVSAVVARLVLPAAHDDGSFHQAARSERDILHYRIARVGRRNSVDSPATTTSQPSHKRSSNGPPGASLFYLPPEPETSALIDRFFNDTGLLFPYIHEESFRAIYTRLRRGDFTSIGRTWLGLLNMILAMATYTSFSPGQHPADRQASSEVLYRRAARLCEGHVMKTATVEIVQYLLLVSQYMQGNKSSIQTSATHGLAVKVAMQLGLHSTEASKRFPSLEREIRKRVWFGCIVLDRSLSMTFGRPPSIPETYCRLDQLTYLDTVESLDARLDTASVKRASTDFFNATIRLYSIMGQVIEMLYGGNLGCGEKLPSYELTISIMKIRRLLEEWVRQLPLHMGLIRHTELREEIASNVLLARFRVILTLRFNNLRVLAHRVVLVRLCELVANNHDKLSIDLSELRDVTGSAVEACAGSAAEIVSIVCYALEDSQGPGRRLMGAWWFTLYYVFDAAMVLFTILILLNRSGGILLPPLVPQHVVQETFLQANYALGHLDKGNVTVERCYWCIKKLGTIVTGPDADDNGMPTRPIPSPTAEEFREVPDLFQADFTDQGLSFLDFNFMGNERLGFMEEDYSHQ